MLHPEMSRYINLPAVQSCVVALLTLVLWSGVSETVLPLPGMAACLAAAPQEDPEESDYPPGLLATYRSGAVEVRRIDPEVAFDWQADRPDQRLPTGNFSADWEGYFLMKAPGEYRFHAWLQGAVEVWLDEQLVLKGEADQPQWISGELLEFPFGELPFKVVFRKTAPEATLKLHWSSPQFALEPVSTFLLFRETGEPELAAIEQGRLAFQAWRCAHCHDAQAAMPRLAAPSLQKTAGHLDSQWIVQKLTQAAGAHDHMPNFSLSAEQAADIADYLLRASEKPTPLPAVKPAKPAEDKKTGELLVRSTGCLACHVIENLGQTGLFGGGELTSIGDKRSVEWLAHWLKNPEQLNSHHRMPQIVLSSNEIRQVAVYLSGLKAGKGASAGSIDKSIDKKTAESSGEPVPQVPLALSRGKLLIEQFRCAACHDIPGVAAEALSPIVLAAGASHTGNSCLQAPPEKSSSEEKQDTPDIANLHQPHFRTAPEKSLALWVQQLRQYPAASQAAAQEFQQGHDLLLQKNCLACHSRDRDPGNVVAAGEIAQFDKRLTGQSQSLIPPHLTAAGDRLQDAALREALQGKQPRRLAWLAVRMPRFQHTTTELEQMEHYLIGKDRLPEGIPDDRLLLTQLELSSSEELLMGRELTGGRAFNCIACHKMGDYEPRNTAVGTKGSDLLGVAGRLRPEYFLRWVRSPLRIVPGMEMPSFNQPRPGFAAHRVEDQLSAIWRAVNDPAFKAPSNPTVVEQYLVIEPGQSPRVIRDVFELKETGQKQRIFVPRPLAAGLNNGHSLLFDLDTASIRGWTYGDFAYQQTEGKSWYWYLAGAPVVTNWATHPDLFLQATGGGSGKTLEPLQIDGRQGFLKQYEVQPDRVLLDYLLKFEVAGAVAEVTVQEVWSALPENPQQKTSGWQRKIRLSHVPAGYQPMLRQQAQQVLLGQPELRVGDQTLPFTAKETLTVSIPAKTASAETDADVYQLTAAYVTELNNRATTPFPEKPLPELVEQSYTGTPGFQARRLPVSASIMPTALAWHTDGRLLLTSLKGQVYAVVDADHDGLPDQLQLIEEGLGAPFGVLSQGNRLLVVHKPEVLELKLEGPSGAAAVRRVLADGWGHTDDYHDWVTGFAVDQSGRVLVGTGSDYAQAKRPDDKLRFRGEVLELKPEGTVQTVATELRYPVGIAADARGRVFVSDQQGVQNCFNEINHIVPGEAYGVPARNHPAGRKEKRASIQIPHPWTRSVNGIFFIPEDRDLGALSAFAGHGVGCEYNNRFLVRFSLQEVNGELQGACYELTRSIESLTPDAALLQGPICGGVGPDGHIYVGSIHDSGWLGGQNVGEIVRLEVEPQLPAGIRELRAIPGGFEVEFTTPLEAAYLNNPANYDLSGYTRVWQGAYASPDSGRYRPVIQKIEVSPDHRLVKILVDELKPAYVYDFHLKNRTDLFPASAYYTMNQVPAN